MAATIDPETRTTLETRLAELDGVMHASVDSRNGDLWVVRDPAYELGPIELAVRSRIASLGQDPAAINVRITLPAAAGPRRRVRFVGVEREDAHGRVGITVQLEWNDQVVAGTSIGDRGTALELRTTAQAAVDALEKLSQQPLDVRIIGIKPIHAFDSDLMVASLIRSDGIAQRLVGAVVVGGELLDAAALAVLSALNRTMGNFLHTAD